jgi:hypothetical protein
MLMILKPFLDKDKYEPSHKALLVWSPNAHITDEKCKFLNILRKY